MPATDDRPEETAPYVLTEEEAVRMFRGLNPEDPRSLFDRCRQRGQLPGFQLGNHVRFTLCKVISAIGHIVKEEDGPPPNPYLLSEVEAINFLRLERTKNPAGTLRRYRKMGVLVGTPTDRGMYYGLSDLMSFLEKQAK